MITFIMISILISAFLVLILLIFGQNIFEKILAVNSFANYLIVLMSCMSLFRGSSSFIDIALIYVMINFIASSAFRKFYKNKGL